MSAENYRIEEHYAELFAQLREKDREIEDLRDALTLARLEVLRRGEGPMSRVASILKAYEVYVRAMADLNEAPGRGWDLSEVNEDVRKAFGALMDALDNLADEVWEVGAAQLADAVMDKHFYKFYPDVRRDIAETIRTAAREAYERGAKTAVKRCAKAPSAPRSEKGKGGDAQ